MLAIALAASMLPRARLGLWGRGADRPRGAAGVAGDADAIGLAGSSAAEGAREGADARSVGRRTDAGDGGRSDGAGPTGPDLARDRDGGDAGGGGRGRASGVEQVLVFFDEVERQVDAAMARARESVVALEYTAGHASAGRRRIASGVVINSRGDILSVRIDPPPGDSAAAGKKGRDPAPIVARDYLGRRHAARWLAADSHTGLTLLRVSPKAVRPIRPAADGPKLASQVFVLGNPFGMAHSVNRGHVAGLDRALDLGEDQRLGGLFQVQAPLYPGDSGAAVVDVRGGWLGLIRGGLAIPGTGRPSPATDPGAAPKAPAPAEGAGDGEADTDFGFAIPTRDALWIADQLRAHGRVDRASLGVRLETMLVSEGPAAAPEPSPSAPAPGATPDPAAAWRGAAVAGPIPPAPADVVPPSAAAAESDQAPVPGDGARIFEVVPGTPAAEAGLRPGDRIVALDRRPIRSHNDLIDQLDRIPARTDIVLGVVREGEPSRPRFEVTVRTASRSGQPGPAPVAAQGASSEPPSTSTGAGVPVTPTASRAEPAAPAPAPPPSRGSNPAPSSSGGSNPAPPTSGEAHPGPGTADLPSATPRRDAAPASVATVPDRSDAIPPATGSLSELKLTLPRAVVERIEHLERRIDELEQFRAGSGPGAANPVERDPRSQAAAPIRQGERPGRPSGRPGP